MWNTILGWVAQAVLRGMLKKGIKEANKTGKKYFTWERSRIWREWEVRQIEKVKVWANKHLDPDLKADDEFLGCMAMRLESDRLAQQYNKDKPARHRIDPHADGGMAVPGGY